jgi:hypothetical protein
LKVVTDTGANTKTRATTEGRPYEIPFEKTLFVEAGTRVPFDLLPAAWHFLDKWDAAVPLYRYGVTAADVGTKKERELTRMIVRDLRVMLHSTELLFVRKSEAGKELMNSWKLQMEIGDGDERLAFLRAFYIVKPLLCVLPTTWLIEVRGRSAQSWSRGQRRSPNAGKALVTVELSPGRFVKVHAGDEEKVLAQFARQRGGR